MKDEILAGLKNGMARGENIEQAMQSFVNAGYNLQDVQEAGRFFSTGTASAVVYTDSLPPKQNVSTIVPPSPPVEQQTEVKNEAKQIDANFNKIKSGNGKKIALVVGILIALLALGGALVYLILALK